MKRILITIPMWNEAAVIAANLKMLQECLQPLRSSFDLRIEVVDNGSTDGSGEIVRNFSNADQSFLSKNVLKENAEETFSPESVDASSLISLVTIAEPGKGGAIRASWIRHLDDADILMFMDADLATDLEAVPRLIASIMSGESNIVCGSRFVRGARVERRIDRLVASWIYRLLQTIVLRLPVKDAQCGFKAVSAAAARDLLPRCVESGWMFDTELLAWAKVLHKNVVEIPVTWRDDRMRPRQSAIRLFRDSWGFVFRLFQIRIRMRNRKKA